MSEDFLKVFLPGEKIKATETNDNNQYLLNQITEKAAELQQYLENQIAILQGSFVLPGMIIGYPSGVIPVGYFLCDGASYLREDYPDLFLAIGTTFGAVDDYHFNVPDYRGLFLRGYGGSSGSIGINQGYKNPTVTVPNTGWGTSGGSLGSITSGKLAVGSGNGEIGEALESLRSSANSRAATVEGENYPANSAVNWLIKY